MGGWNAATCLVDRSFVCRRGSAFPSPSSVPQIPGSFERKVRVFYLKKKKARACWPGLGGDRLALELQTVEVRLTDLESETKVEPVGVLAHGIGR